MKRKIFVQHLHQHGCALIREGANHSWWGHAGNNRRSSVPRHAEINDLLVKKIRKDLEIPAPGKT